MVYRVTFLGLLGLIVPALALAAEPAGLDKAHELWQTGRYAESVEAYDALRDDPALTSPEGQARLALGRAEALASQGKVEEAVEALKAVADAQAEQPSPALPDVLARLADFAFSRGEWDRAEDLARQALKAQPEHLRARWVVGRLDEARGTLDPNGKPRALATWKWFVEHYNAHAQELAETADALILIGQAAEKYFRAEARGEDLSEQLNGVINAIYEGALQADPRCWQAPWLEGRLFLSGYNERGAKKELNRAILINPRAAEVLVTLGQADLQGYQLADGRKKAETALEINPRYAPARVLLADLAISDERFDDALADARKAVAETPKDEDALARLAAAYRLLVDPVGASLAEAVVLGNNPRPATFYAALGERLADRRKYHSAERAFLLAVAADPERADARIGLGMLYMQIGREQEAHDLFNAAFEADPFNVRADNMMKVLKHLAPYKTIKTDHFSVLVDPAQDELIGTYMAKFLESVYGDLTSRFGYEPPGTTQIEILKNHQWFSGRTTGLPFIPTVGACTGKVVALASPRSTQKPFNWARVLVHEVTHVITLQQTDFNIPHWYTEALAVESEATPRPQAWNKMLMERVPARKLLNLDTINLGFIRPSEPEERQLAYCQAQLYAQYMAKRFGPTAQVKMLEAYRRGLTTDKAIPVCFGIDQADFEAGYLTFVTDVVKTIRTRVSEEPPVKFSELERQVRAKPDDPNLNAQMAYEHFARRDYKAARPFADQALKLDPHNPLASYVKARLFVTIGDPTAALALLEPALDPEQPNERVIDLLAELQMKAGNLDEAERLYEMARQDDPVHSKWIAGLARVHLRQNREDKFLHDLTLLAANDSDDLTVRLALAERSLKDGSFDQAVKWATECLYIQVYDPHNHELLADALAGSKKFPEAIEEYETALTLKPKKPNDIKVRLARAQADSGQPDAARATLDTILQADPDHPEAKALRQELSRTPADSAKTTGAREEK